MRNVVLCLTLVFTATEVHAQAVKKPNVVVIIADDMGHGDLGCHGNPIIRTPHLDRLAKQSVRMKNFYVSPVCSPTRSSLLTGRYNYRTGVVDTFIGRSMMHGDERTLAEILRSVGYATGIFGKWHLGDCYPLRAVDQGFTEALVHRGGGIGQPSDPPDGRSYFDPVLQHNGKEIRTKGYCSDVYVDHALEFVRKNQDRPFLVYLPFNAPHDPLQLPAKYHNMYKDADFERSPKFGFPLQGKIDADKTARVYGMVTNIDDNVGRLLALLDELKLADNTIVIFLTDNGPQHPRYNSGMRGRKGSVFEGGTRVPFFVRWPSALPADLDIDRIAAHIDITPTVVAACGAEMPNDRKIDGINLLPLWKRGAANWPDRSLYFQWHRGDVPELHRACAVRSQKYRLVQAEGVQEKEKVKAKSKADWMLFDIEADPYEQKNLANERSEVVQKMRADYEAWFKDVASTRNFEGPRIHLGSDSEIETWLTRQDWRGPNAGWAPKNIGYWDVTLEKQADFEITVHLPEKLPKANVQVRLLGQTIDLAADAGQATVRIPTRRFSAGQGRLEVLITAADTSHGAQYVVLRRK